jgi:thiamine transport system substrate-binding protein
VLKKLLPLLALVAMPALAKPVLTVYTYDSFSPTGALARRSKSL